MTTVAFATSDAWPAMTPDDRLAADALEARGVRVLPAVWSDPAVEWASFDAIIVRSTWDYHKRFDEFAQWLELIAHGGHPVWNPCALLRWNANKRYLLDLEERGVPIVPTALVTASDPDSLLHTMRSRGWEDVVVKPVISATAYGMHRVRMRDLAVGASVPSRGHESPGMAGSAISDGARESGTARGEFLVQPFVADIASSGEWSLMFFNGAFSHSVRKRPHAGDFRVQTEYGGSSVAEQAPRAVIAAAERVVAAVTGPWLYARVDGVETSEGFLLMELEMLEPLLFFELDGAAPKRFADALLALPGR